MKVESLKPYGDRIVIRPLEESEISSSTLIIPDLGKEKSKIGEVMAVGAGMFTITGQLIPMESTIGDIVVYPKFGCHTIEVDTKEYLVIKEQEVFCKINVVKE